MIQIKLIPSNSYKIPPKAQSHDILSDILKNISSLPDGANVNWRDVQRVIPATHDYLILRLDESMESTSKQTRTAISECITNNITGVEEHPNGWEKIEP